MEHLLRLVESAPLLDLQHRVAELLKTGERSLEDQRNSLEGLGRLVNSSKKWEPGYWSLRKMKDCSHLDVQEGLLDRLRTSRSKTVPLQTWERRQMRWSWCTRKWSFPCSFRKWILGFWMGWTESSDRTGAQNDQPTNWSVWFQPDRDRCSKEDTLCSELPALVKAWNLERLQMECETEAQQIVNTY